jgi:hypothetical protein
LTIIGTSLAGATAVRFGSTEAASFKVNSPTSLTAVSPPHARGRADVTVTTPSGPSATSKKDQFRYR